MNTKQQCSVAWLYQGMMASHPLPLTINHTCMHTNKSYLTLKNLLKSNCFKRDLKELKLRVVTITSESEFQARVTRLVHKIMESYYMKCLDIV